MELLEDEKEMSRIIRLFIDKIEVDYSEKDKTHSLIMWFNFPILSDEKTKEYKDYVSNNPDFQDSVIHIIASEPSSLCVS